MNGIFASVILCVGAAQAAPAPAPSARAELKAAVEKLQDAPDDLALREKIIALSKKVKPAPAVPEEARKHFVQAVALQKDAKSPSDFDDVLSEYKQALRLAPWWGDAYYNMSIAAESAGRLDAAQSALKLFIDTKPKPVDLRQAQDRLYALEAKQRKAAKAKAAEEEKYGWLLGSWRYDYQMPHMPSENETGLARGEKVGDKVELSVTEPRADKKLRAAVQSSGEVSWEYWGGDPRPGLCDAGWQPIHVDVSPDRRTLSLQRTLHLAGRCDQESRFTQVWTFTHE